MGVVLDSGKLKANSTHDKFTADIGEAVDVWLELTVNEWQGRRSVEGRLLRLEVV